MEHSRRAVSTYIEAFILIGIAMGGSALVFEATQGYSAAVGGPAVTVTNLSLSQGSNVAVVQMVIADTGTTTFSSVTISLGTFSSSSYCLTMTNQATSAPVQPYTGTCSSPTGSTTGSVTATPASAIGSGQVILTTITIYAKVFTVGVRYSVMVTTSAGAQEQVSGVATPA